MANVSIANQAIANANYDEYVSNGSYISLLDEIDLHVDYVTNGHRKCTVLILFFTVVDCG